MLLQILSPKKSETGAGYQRSARNAKMSQWMLRAQVHFNNIQVSWQLTDTDTAHTVSTDHFYWHSIFFTIYRPWRKMRQINEHNRCLGNNWSAGLCINVMKYFLTTPVIHWISHYCLIISFNCHSIHSLQTWQRNIQLSARSVWQQSSWYS